LENGGQAMATPPKGMDRRVQRTRQSLQQAFKEVTQEKSFEATNIQDITDRANVNRGTFYAHFEDKYALLEAIIREEFHDLLTNHIPPVDHWDRQTVQSLIQNVLEYFNRTRRRCHLSAGNVALFERATHEELSGLLLTWLQQSKCAENQVPLETVAQIMSCAIFGGAIKWSQEMTKSSEQMANDVLLVIMDGVGRLAPVTE
jgi:AcrR family transcriptional regulator